MQSTGVEDQKLFCLVQDNFLTQHVIIIIIMAGMAVF